MFSRFTANEARNILNKTEIKLPESILSWVYRQIKDAAKLGYNYTIVKEYELTHYYEVMFQSTDYVQHLRYQRTKLLRQQLEKDGYTVEGFYRLKITW